MTTIVKPSGYLNPRLLGDPGRLETSNTTEVTPSKEGPSLELEYEFGIIESTRVSDWSALQTPELSVVLRIYPDVQNKNSMVILLSEVPQSGTGTGGTINHYKCRGQSNALWGEKKVGVQSGRERASSGLPRWVRTCGFYKLCLGWCYQTEGVGRSTQAFVNVSKGTGSRKCRVVLGKQTQHLPEKVTMES